LTKKKSFNSIIVFVLLLSALLFINSDNYITALAAGDEWENATTTVTETGSNPSPITPVLNNNIAIDLTAATTKIVNCVATVTDSNGYADIQNGKGNITVYNALATDSTCTANNLNCYKNETFGISTTLGSTLCPNSDDTSVECTLSVALQFNTNQSADWRCNMTIADSGGSLGTATSPNPCILNGMIAININDSSMDFGAAVPTEFADNEVVQNISNYGNTIFNLSVNGTEMDCAGTAPNIAVGNISYNFTGISTGIGTGLGENNLTETSTEREFNLYPNLTVTADIPLASTNNTWWRLWLPQASQSRGICTGEIWFVGS
jgi:hypothetical protein